VIQAAGPERLQTLLEEGDPLYGPLLCTERVVAGRYPALGSRFWLCLDSLCRPAAVLNGRPAGLFLLCALPPFTLEDELVEEAGMFLRLNGCRTLSGSLAALPLLCERAGLPPPRSAPVMKTDGRAAVPDSRAVRADEDPRRIFTLIGAGDNGGYDEWLCGLRVRAADGFCAAYAIYEDGVPVSAAMFTGADTRRAVIGGVAAAPDRRGRGYGSAIVRHLAAEARRAGKESVVACREESLAGFYRPLGFTPCGRWYSASMDDR